MENAHGVASEPWRRALDRFREIGDLQLRRAVHKRRLAGRFGMAEHAKHDRRDRVDRRLLVGNRILVRLVRAWGAGRVRMDGRGCQAKREKTEDRAETGECLHVESWGCGLDDWRPGKLRPAGRKRSGPEIWGSRFHCHFGPKSNESCAVSRLLPSLGA